MKSPPAAVACCLVLALADPSLAADAQSRTDELNTKMTLSMDNLVGVWTLTKSENAPPGCTVEFTRDGKMIVIIKEDGKIVVKVEGAYTREKGSITSNLKNGDEEHKETVKIKKLTYKELIVEDERGKVDEFKKK